MNEKLKKYIVSRYYKVAVALADNPEGLKYKISKIKEKLSKSSISSTLGNYLDDFKRLFRMLVAWSKADYTDISKSSIIYTILCLIYFLTPTDFVPDIIIGFGFIDDITVLKWTLDKIKEDIDKFRKWEEKDESTS
ncbi:MAG: DUF1232 domain-containing protein [Bacteriovoracaceae bacterium]|jgi:uncharacterized membrane protein YkvA (DUF1232 family)|nr:DUF1232 domain-containing protein [Bacteriovoracaceae bacterium]